MVNKAFFVKGREIIDCLGIPRGAQCCQGEHLGFAACKKRAAMGPRENAHFAGNRSNFIKRAVINAAAFFKNQVAAGLFLQVTEEFIDLFFPIRVVLSEAFKNFGLHFSKGGVAIHLVRD